MADTRGAEPVGAYFGFYLLAMGSGRPRRAGELLAHLLREAGFRGVRVRCRPAGRCWCGFCLAALLNDNDVDAMCKS